MKFVSSPIRHLVLRIPYKNRFYNTCTIYQTRPYLSETSLSFQKCLVNILNQYINLGKSLNSEFYEEKKRQIDTKHETSSSLLLPEVRDRLVTLFSDFPFMDYRLVSISRFVTRRDLNMLIGLLHTSPLSPPAPLMYIMRTFPLLVNLHLHPLSSP